MDQLNLLTKTLKTLKRVSHDIIITALPIMKDLESPDNDLIVEFLEDNPNVYKQLAVEILQRVSIDLVEDAQTVNKEIESFSECVIHGEEGLTEGGDEFPFLLQVWYGDMYGKSGVEGLQVLAEDLQEQLSHINEDKILETANEVLETM